jgi:hypothetical protein
MPTNISTTALRTVSGIGGRCCGGIIAIPGYAGYGGGCCAA